MSRRWIVLAVACVMSVSLARADVDPVDRTPPDVAFSTASGAIVLNLYAYQDRIGGSVDDDLSGVDRVDVTFRSPDSGLESEGRADLGCSDGSRRTCNWLILPPLAPGRYTATVRATDLGGNATEDGPRITIVVA